jgi:nucleoside phosphorylase
LSLSELRKLNTLGSNRIVVLTALPLEADAVRSHLPSRIRRDLPNGTIVEEGMLPGTEYSVCLVWTGSGNGQAAVVADRVISWAEPAAVLVVGIAGSLKHDIALGDVVVATRVMGYQRGKDTVGGFRPDTEAWDGAYRLLQAAHYAQANSMWQRFLPDIARQPTPAVHFKPIVSGDIVKDTADSSLSELIRTTYYGAAAIEMEAAGVSRAAHLAETNVLVIRGISDPSDGSKNSSDTSGWQPRAAGHAAAFALGMITALPAPEPTSRHDLGQGAETSAVPTANLEWSVLAQAPDVSWRTGLHDTQSIESSILELHLVPVDASTRLQMVQLRSLWGELVRLGRSRGFFGQAEAVEGKPTSDNSVAFVREARGSGSSALGILRSGQRSAWETLPKVEGLGIAIFDPGYIAKRLTALLDLLLLMPAPLPARMVPVAGIAPATMITRGTVGGPRQSSATFRMNGQIMRTEAVESINSDGLSYATDQVAEELAARLDQAFDSRR